MCQENRLNMILGGFAKTDISALATRTKTITAITRLQATCSQSNWSLLPSVVHRRGLWKRPHTRLHNYPEKHRQRSRTVRHNRVAQAEVTTPYPGPRFPGRYSGTL